MGIRCSRGPGGGGSAESQRAGLRSRCPEAGATQQHLADARQVHIGLRQRQPASVRAELSNHSQPNGSCVEIGIGLEAADWRKSSRSTGTNGGCVEIGHASGLVGIRDTKNRAGGTLSVSGTAFGSLILAIKEGNLR